MLLLFILHLSLTSKEKSKYSALNKTNLHLESFKVNYIQFVTSTNTHVIKKYLEKSKHTNSFYLQFYFLCSCSMVLLNIEKLSGLLAQQYQYF